jgi:hypothetical protein
MRGLIAFTLLILMACTPVAPAASPTTGWGGDPQAAGCAMEGGTMQPVCRRQTMQCVIAYSDAGRTCRDGDDCQGDCRAEPNVANGINMTGRCQADSDPCGCFTLIEDGRAQAGLCVD